MSTLNIDFLEKEYPSIREKNIQGRWITFNDIKKLYANLPDFIDKEEIGTSEQGRPIYKLKL